ncbi:hypothetical protein [Spirosoma rhododendri]|uniref:Lipoprotein n=1 Tax=Spirosoma rhododendri TaxID=2728024 RepID=A0A7L5DR20_9BACT|nr:hypothetical protein [Spirosoma rhododendri]QJD80052.1 hypothetical protein HH216_17755 [Spirosoma rhododendri]
MRYLLLLSFVWLLSCQREPVADTGPWYDYAPVATGRYNIYDVSEQRYALNAAPLQRTYQVKEVVGTPYTDATGQPAYRLLRYRRASATTDWQLDSIWAVQRTDNQLLRTENGQAFVSLLFPVRERLQWNGNRYNALGEEPYELRNVGLPYRVSDTTYDQTLTVVGQNDSTLVSQDKRLTVFAQQVGIVYRERVQLQFCSSTPACVGTNQIDYGIRQIYRLRQYGTN